MQVLSHGSLADPARNGGPTVVVFAAQWCSPSQNLIRLLQQIELMPTVNVQVVDVDAHPDLAARFGVRGLPTTMLVKDGAVEATRLGDLPAHRLTEWLGNLI